MSEGTTSDSSRLDLTVIVVSYNSEGRIGQAVRRHQEATRHLSAELIVVDNASTDGSVAEAESDLHRGRVIANRENVGYGQAVNQALRLTKGRLSLIMNDDASVDSDSVDALIAALDADPSIALVGPRIVDEAGRPMPAARDTFPGLFEELARIRHSLSRWDHETVYPVRDEHPEDVDWLVGACILGRTDVLVRHGGFNSAFFLYGEDIDLSRRLRHLGYRVVTVPSAVCVHTGSVSTGSSFSEQARVRRRSDARDIYYRIWLPRPVRALVHLRQALGTRRQPYRLLYHLPKVLYDGPSLPSLRFPQPLQPGHVESGR